MRIIFEKLKINFIAEEKESFISWWCFKIWRKRFIFRNKHEVISAFKRFDENCDGSLSQQELVSGVGALGLNLSSTEVKAIFTLAEVNQDGEVNYTEFVSA